MKTKPKTAHTPGPWAFAEGDSDRRASSSVFKATDKDFLIANVTCEWANQEQRAEDIANARLIAAAPDLLIACQLAAEFVASIRKNLVGLHRVHADNLAATVSLAIKKATQS